MLLVDGHNLIGKLPNISLSDPDDEAKLVRVLENYYAVHPHQEVLVVFDPARDGGGWHGVRDRSEGVTVRFAPHGVTADDVLARLVRDAKSPRSITVVSSDNAVRRAVRGHGAKILRAEEFIEQLDASMRPRRSAAVSAPTEEREKPADTEIEYWSRIFTEPPSRPSAPARKPKPRTAEPQPSKRAHVTGEKPERAEDIDYWLRVLSAPRSDADKPVGGIGSERLPPTLVPPKAPESPERAKRRPEVDSVDYWLLEMSRKRPAE
jgi:uncharacterized protein